MSNNELYLLQYNNKCIYSSNNNEIAYKGTISIICLKYWYEYVMRYFSMCIWFNFILRCTIYLGFFKIGKTFETTCFQIIWYARNSQRYSLYLSGYKLTPMKRHVSDKWPEKLPHQDSQTASIKFNTRYK